MWVFYTDLHIQNIFTDKHGKNMFMFRLFFRFLLLLLHHMMLIRLWIQFNAAVCLCCW